MKTNKTSLSMRTKVMAPFKRSKCQRVSMVADTLQELSCITEGFSIHHIQETLIYRLVVILLF